MVIHPAPSDPVAPPRWSAEQYLALADDGTLGPDDRMELLEGVVVAMAPQNVPHAAGVFRVEQALHEYVRKRALVRIQLPFLAGRFSVPEPDALVVGGRVEDYDRRHPSTALLVVEVADSSLTQDRLTKAGIYAAAGVPEYWIVNLRDDCVEMRRGPDAESRRYATTAIARRGDVIDIVALPGVHIPVDELLPSAD